MRYLLPLYLILALLPLLGVAPSLAGETFPICGYDKRVQCVVDGDTFWLGGVKYRLYEIDAPEIASGARCQQEYETGVKSAYFLRSLLQSGITGMVEHGKDRYGRILVSVETRSGNAS